MDIETVLKKYIETVESDAFISYEKDFASKITIALSKHYRHRSDETDMVEIIERMINSCKNLTIKSSQPYFKLSTNAIFIHGYPKKSGVEFDYYGEPGYTELGDIIFIISIIFNGQRYFEKFTINQFKKDSQKTKSVSWNINNKKQLYLLSRFPKFRGVKGSLVPRKDFNLPNYSGCLGSYGLLYGPGDFAFVSATELDSFIGHRNSLKMDELYNLTWETEKYSFPHLPELLYLDNYRAHAPWWRLPRNPFGNYHHAYNTFDFAHKYLTMGIGEPTFMKIGMYNSQAKSFLHDLLSALKNKAKTGDPVDNFTDRFFKCGYTGNEEGGFRESIKVDFEEGGLGIIHTIIYLGE